MGEGIIPLFTLKFRTKTSHNTFPSHLKTNISISLTPKQSQIMVSAIKLLFTAFTFLSWAVPSEASSGGNENDSVLPLHSNPKNFHSGRAETRALQVDGSSSACPCWDEQLLDRIATKNQEAVDDTLTGLIPGKLPGFLIFLRMTRTFAGIPALRLGIHEHS